jgi:hypothetical protein
MSEVLRTPIRHKLWQAQQLRLTAFPLDPVAAADANWWASTFEEPPESSTRKRGGLSLQQGPIGGYLASVIVDLERITWTFEGAIDAEQGDVPGVPITLGPLTESLSACTRHFDRAVERLPPTRRLAFGAALNLPVADREEGYRQLDEFLPSVQVSPESYDFRYTINRRRASKSGIQGLYVNRLSNWMVMDWRVLASESPFRPGAPVRSLARSFACRLELDVNTSGDRIDALPQESLLGIWNELVESGVEIADLGDVP